MIITAASTSAVAPPPLSPYGVFQGTLYQYHNSLVAFESAATRPNKCILLGGLSDGLIPTPYARGLHEVCESLSCCDTSSNNSDNDDNNNDNDNDNENAGKDSGWSLVQPILSSSYFGFGNGSLDRDVEELSALFRYLVHHGSAEKFCLVGHSTGCQISVHFCKHAAPEWAKLTKGVVLQAPVSDREHAMMNTEEYETNVRLAQDMVSRGEEEEIMPRRSFWAPLTAQRYLDLHQVKGKDDYFSSDLSDAELEERLGNLISGDNGEGDGEGGHCDILVACSGADEYVPSHVDSNRLLERLCRAMKGDNNNVNVKPLLLTGANHNLSTGTTSIDEFLSEVKELLKKIT